MVLGLLAHHADDVADEGQTRFDERRLAWVDACFEGLEEDVDEGHSYGGGDKRHGFERLEAAGSERGQRLQHAVGVHVADLEPRSAMLGSISLCGRPEFGKMG